MKKAPRNYSQDLDRRRQGLDAIVGKLDSIPDPSTDDEGKVLKVDDEGSYALLPDGGSQVMTVAISYDSEQEEYSVDKTHAEIIAAIAAGVIVTATYNNRTFVYAGKNQPSAFDAVYFSYLQADSESQFIGKIIEIDEDDRITYSEHDLNNENVLPAVTSADYEKILQVDDQGNWVASINNFEVGDTYRIPHNYPYIEAFGTITSGQPYGAIDFHLPIMVKKINTNNVKWFEFSSNTKINIRSNDGSVMYTNQNFNNVFDIVYSYSNVGEDYINLYLLVKQGFDFTSVVNKIVLISFINSTITFTNSKPTT